MFLLNFFLIPLLGRKKIRQQSSQKREGRGRGGGGRANKNLIRGRGEDLQKSSCCSDEEGFPFFCCSHARAAQMIFKDASSTGEVGRKMINLSCATPASA